MSTTEVVYHAAAGVGMGAALILSGMAQTPIRSVGLLNIAWAKAGAWDSGLGVTFACALVPSYFLYKEIRKRPKPVLSEKFLVTKRNDVTFDLIVGGMLFGLGWSLSGYCPGPAFLAAAGGVSGAVWTAASMCIGWSIFKHLRSREEGSSPLSSYHAGSLAALVGALAVGAAGVAVSHTYARAVVPAPVWRPAVGGLLLALVVHTYLWLDGDVLGLSGVMGNLFHPNLPKWPKRVAFIVGIALPGLIARLTGNSGAWLAPGLVVPVWRSVLGGALVGYGTAMGSGCTSGHGLHGVSRLSTRSMIATASFFGALALGVNLWGSSVPV